MQPDLSLLTLVDAGLRGVLIALLLMLAAVLQRDRPRLTAARLGAALCLGLVLQTVGATPLVDNTWPRTALAPLVAVSVANGVLFWLFVRALFDDAFRWRAWHGFAWAGVAALAAFNCTVVAGQGSVLSPVFFGLQRAVPLVCAVLALQAAAEHWRDDLVEARRRLRGFIVVAGAAYTLAMLAVRVASPQGRLSDLAATVDTLLLLAAVAPAAWQLLRLTPTELFPARAESAPAPARPSVEPAAAADPADERLEQALARLMQQSNAYRTEDLTLGLLALKLDAPEYRLRRVINQRLGHRNFNAYINGLRLQDASAALADPARREEAVLAIALASGFQSIGPFNRAFKAAFGLTPSEFRRQHLGQRLADS